ncbi:MAG: Gfo/Idh/MocA family oxidoreductase [Bacteroidales bacterium]|nr:Gfo/Idh/MocA family oxidoreductase [Bacteroidales bacterium]
MNRKDFIKSIGLIGSGLLMASSPWLNVFSEEKKTVGYRARIGIIGTGSRGQLLMKFLAKNPKVEIVAICDIYQPSIDKALRIVPGTRIYKDYRSLLENKNVDAVVIATPLDQHYPMVMDAFEVGKHVFCEKSIAYCMEDTFRVYQKYLNANRVFFVGQQRLFDPSYIKAMEMVHNGTLGSISALRMYWHRNNDWRRPIDKPELDEQINWRLYNAHSKGIMTELACHQLQIGTWARRQIPNKVLGHGAITFWKENREVYDNASLIYIYDDGVKMNYDSVLSNKFYGLEEQILCSNGTLELEKNKLYYEEIEPAPAFLQMINEAENKLFDALPFAGTSWVPETANENKGHHILDAKSNGDGTSLMLYAFAESVITGTQPSLIAEEGYYATQLSLLGHQAMEEGKTLIFPDEYKINYLNHKLAFH